MNVREVRIRAAVLALVQSAPEIVEADEIYDMAVAVVDTLFTPDALVDNATVPNRG